MWPSPTPPAQRRLAERRPAQTLRPGAASGTAAAGSGPRAGGAAARLPGGEASGRGAGAASGGGAARHLRRSCGRGLMWSGLRWTIYPVSHPYSSRAPESTHRGSRQPLHSMFRANCGSGTASARAVPARRAAARRGEGQLSFVLPASNSRCGTADAAALRQSWRSSRPGGFQPTHVAFRAEPVAGRPAGDRRIFIM